MDRLLKNPETKQTFSPILLLIYHNDWKGSTVREAQESAPSTRRQTVTPRKAPPAEATYHDSYLGPRDLHARQTILLKNKMKTLVRSVC